jgi:hypothetical protein
VKTESDSIIDELDSRLDDFFADDEGPVSGVDDVKLSAPKKSLKNSANKSTAIPKQSSSLSNNPLNNLKAIVLEMDWEISDDNLSNYINEISRLMTVYSNDKVLFLFFKLHNSIGKYLISKKASAHPDSIKFLHSVFSSLEKVINTPNISGKERNDLVLEEVKNFKRLKEQIIPATVTRKKVRNSNYSGMEKNNAKTGKIKEPQLKGLPESVRDELLKYIQDLVRAEIVLNKK